MIDSGRSGPMERIKAWFPEREFIMRSQGQVRFVRFSSRLQAGAAAVLAFAVLLYVGSLGGVLVAELVARSDHDSLLNREARVAASEGRVSAYRKDLRSVADDLARRQAFIEKVVESHVGTLPAVTQGAGETVSDSSSEAAKTVRKVSAVLPEASGLARIEARQLAFVERLTLAADRRAAVAEKTIRTAGLDPRRIVSSSSDRSAQGGPLIPLLARGQEIDPRFERLGASLARMEALERGLAGIPNVLPASLDYISSGFGYRSDPFTGAPALHAGLDFKGPIGAPIYAAARGRVIFAGVQSGYGNCVEVDHGNGLVTRYAHMSRIQARVGDVIAAGGVLGAIGSTGRSTGPHLHFEVRLNGRAVNPRPFLEASSHVQGFASKGGQAARG